MSDVARPGILPDARPRLARGVRLTRSDAHDSMVLLAPERVFKADAIATAILQHCTGESSFAAIVDTLAAAYGAPRERIEADAGALIAGLVEKRLVEFVPDGS